MLVPVLQVFSHKPLLIHGHPLGGILMFSSKRFLTLALLFSSVIYFRLILYIMFNLVILYMKMLLTQNLLKILF